MSLEARALSIRRGSRLLLDSVSLSVRPGRVHALLGPNGAGKTSLLSALSGDEASKAVVLDGRPLSVAGDLTLARRRAVMEQHDLLDFPLSAAEVVALGRLPHAPESRALENAYISAALEAVDASELAERAYPSLSGGERTRVRLARAAVQVWEQFKADASPLAPRYLLLDEPAAHLDPGHQHAALKLARRFADNGGGVLVTLHDPALALRWGDDATLLAQGQIVATGTIEETLNEQRLSQLYGVPLGLHRLADGRVAVSTGTSRQPSDIR